MTCVLCSSCVAVHISDSEEGHSLLDDDEEAEAVGERRVAELSDQGDRFTTDDEDRRPENWLIEEDKADSKDHQMVAEHSRSLTPSGTDDVAAKEARFSPTPTNVNNADKNDGDSLTTSNVNDALTRTTTAQQFESEQEEINLTRKSTDTMNKDKHSTDERELVDPTVKEPLVNVISSTPASAGSRPVDSAISLLVDKYSLQHGAPITDDIAATGRSSSVAQLESFVASVAAVDCKPPSSGGILLLPPPPPLVPATQPVVTSGGAPAVSSSSSSVRHHSKPSKSKSASAASSNGSGHGSKSGGGKTSSKTMGIVPPSSSAPGAKLMQNSPSVYSAVGVVAPVVPLQCVTSGPGAMPAAAASTGGGDQPLDLSMKSSRHEAKYLSPDATMTSCQGPSSLLSLERQFGKGSAIFDRIGTKAWTAPYCATAMRFGLAAYTSPSAGAILSPAGLPLVDSAAAASAPHHVMAPPPPPPSQHSAGSTSSVKSSGSGRSAGVGKDDVAPKVPQRRVSHISPTDASSLLPWAQPSASSDHKKHSTGATNSQSTLSSTATTSNTAPHQHTHTNFRCSCGASTDTLYDLTLHIQKTGHAPAPPPSAIAPLAADADATSASSGSRNSSSATSGASGASASSSSTSSSRPYEYSKLVRGQDVWLSGGGERTRRSILRCIECGESFRSLPELTVHMVHTRHYTNIVGAGSSGSDPAASGGTSSHHHHHHHSQSQQQQPQRKQSMTTNDKLSTSATGSSSRSKGSPPTGTNDGSPTLPRAVSASGSALAVNASTTVSSPPNVHCQATTIRSMDDFRYVERDGRKMTMTTCCSDDEDDLDDADSMIRTPRRRRDGDGGSSSCSGSRTSSPVGSISSPPTAGRKRSWSRMTSASAEEEQSPLVDRRRSQQTEEDSTKHLGQMEESGSEKESRDSKSADVERRRHLTDKSSHSDSACRQTAASPSTPVDCRRRLSPDGMSAGQLLGIHCVKLLVVFIWNRCGKDRAFEVKKPRRYKAIISEDTMPDTVQ